MKELFTVHLFLFSLIILITFHNVFAFFLLCTVLIFLWYLIKIYTKFRSGGSIGGFSLSSDGYFIISALL